jgi:phosphoribosylformylglycinamidine synthase
MAVVIAPEDLDSFMAGAAAENLEATVVAAVTAEARLKMHWRGQTIVNLSRAFLNTNGVSQKARVQVSAPNPEENFFPKQSSRFAQKALKEAWLENLEQLDCCSQKGLVERFDSTIGAGSVLLPFGGKCQLTPAEGMAAKLPVMDGETTTATLMTFGYPPQISRWSPFHGAVYAIVEAVAKIAALGGDCRRVRLTLQEYFEKPGLNPVSWGKPFAALLGAFHAQRQLGIAAIGGKDSMSGTFRDLMVPPTLVTFALCPADASQVLSPEFKRSGSPVILLRVSRNNEEMPDWNRFRSICSTVHEMAGADQILAAHSIRAGGIAEAITKMCLGNWLGFQFESSFEQAGLWTPDYGSLLLELTPEVDLAELSSRIQFERVGTTSLAPQIVCKAVVIPLEEACAHWSRPLEKIFPSQVAAQGAKPDRYSFPARGRHVKSVHLAKPRIFMPVFPGTNCEVDTARAFQRAGGIVDSLVFRNLVPADIGESLSLIARKIGNAQIIMLPGGFSAGDEPEGSGKFIGAVFRNPRIKEAVHRLLKERDGLILGICNGFQALIKLGLVPYGKIRELDPDIPTLTYNTIGRHVSCMVRTRVASTLSPWLWKRQVDDIHTIAISHGEGRFVAEPYWLEHLAKKGQIATQYVDLEGNPTADSRFNPNGSAGAIEGITSPDGRILGKMGHSERVGSFVARNIPGEKDQEIFDAGVEYFQ